MKVKLFAATALVSLIACSPAAALIHPMPGPTSYSKHPGLIHMMPEPTSYGFMRPAGGRAT